MDRVSDPKSPSYGKYWSQAELRREMAIPEERFRVVEEWLGAEGVQREQMTRVDNSIRITAHPSVLERAFRTKVVSVLKPFEERVFFSHVGRFSFLWGSGCERDNSLLSRRAIDSDGDGGARGTCHWTQTLQSLSEYAQTFQRSD